jgi:PTH2 family peptidyl-tRNA hydrolase
MLKQVIIVRKDLQLKKGKLAAQVSHAAILASDKSKFRNEWKKNGQKKVVLQCNNLEEMMDLYKKSIAEKLPTALVEDAGLTHIQPGTKTCIGIGPDKEEKIDKISAHLKLLN